MTAENVSIVAADFETQLSGAIAVGATSFTLQSITDADSVALSDGIYAFTIDRDSSSAKEYFIGQLTAATKTVSSISSVSRQGALTANAQRAHRIGANVIMSDHSVLAAISKIFRGTGKINPASPLEYDTAPTLSAATQLATKGYVDSVVNGGTVNADRIILASQTAGETVAAGSIVYFKSSDSRWWLADADLTATFSNVQLGVAQGSGTAGNAITDGVLIYGKSDNFTGLTATATYYLSNTAGAVASSVGTNTVTIGQAFATTGIFFNPRVGYTVSSGEKDALAGGGAFGTPSTSNKFMTETNGATKKFGGDGSDGALDTSGGTVDIDAASANVVIKNYTSINIATNNLTLSNPASTGTLLILRSQGAVTISASILLNGDGAAAATSAFNYFVDGTLSPAGLNAVSNTGGVAGSTRAAYYTNNTWQLQQGEGVRTLVGSGGGAPTAGGGAGGRGGGGLIIECAGAYNFTGTINTSGVAGTGGTGGGGGGSAGSVIVIYNTLTADSGTYTMAGGAGAAGAAGTNSAGGGGAASAQGVGGAGGNYSGGNGAAGGTGAGGGGGGATSGGGTGTAGAAGATMTAIRLANLYDN